MRNSLFWIATTSLIILMFAYYYSNTNYEFIANDGSVDLTNWNFDEDGIVRLDGSWEFYWAQLLTSADFKNGPVPHNKNIKTIPKTWNNYVINEDKLPGYGYATYRLLINTDVLDEKNLAIKLPKIFTSYRFWINDELVEAYGFIDSQDGDLARNLHKLAYFKTKGDIIELIVQVSNDQHRSGGIAESFYLGTQENIINHFVRSTAFDLFLFGSLFIIGLYHLIFYSYRKKDRSSLYFGLFALLISIRTLFVGEIFFIQLFPDFSWIFAHKIHTLTYYLSVPIILFLLDSLFSNLVAKKVVTIVKNISMGFAVIVIATPPNIFTYINPLYQFITLIIIGYILHVLILACKEKRNGAYFISFGFIILCLTAINDIIHLSILTMDSESLLLKSMFSKGNLTSYGLFVYIFIQSFIMAKKFSLSFKKEEELSSELQHLTDSLERKVQERTIKLEKAYEAISRAEKSRQYLVQNISHDLRTPLTSIKGFVKVVLDQVAVEPNKQRKYLEKVVSKVDLLDDMVRQLLELYQIDAELNHIHPTSVPLNTFIEKVIEEHTLDISTADLDCEINYPSGWEERSLSSSFSVQVDMQQIHRVFSNLISNALNYTSTGGKIEMNFEYIVEDTSISSTKSLVISVTDNGVGISEKDLPFVFDRLYKGEIQGQNRTQRNKGLGLAIVKTILDHHQGDIYVESAVGKGSSFIIKLPLYETIDTFID